MYDGNPGEIDFGSSYREVRVSEGSSYRESTVFNCNKKKCVVAISDIDINAVTLVSGGLLSLAEQRPVRENISTINMVVTLTRDCSINVF